MTNGRIRAASFLEVVIGLFLLTIVFVSICTLVVRAFAVQAKTNQVIKACQMAETVASEVRSWATEPAHFLSDWSGLNTTWSYPEFSGLEARVTVGTGGDLHQGLYSPATAFESPLAVEAKKLLTSFVPVQIQVFDEQDNRMADLYLKIAEPPRELAANPRVTVRTVAGSTTLGRDEVVDFEAELTDENGRVIEDVVFTWSLVPMTGNGTLLNESPKGRTVQLQHVYFAQSGVTVLQMYSSGTVGVLVRAVYRGREITNGSLAAPDTIVQLL